MVDGTIEPMMQEEESEEKTANNEITWRIGRLASQGDLEDRIATLETKVAELQPLAHSEHTINQETLDQIADHVMQRFNERLQHIFHPPQG